MNASRVSDLFSSLVHIDSESLHEREIQQFCAAYLTKLGLVVVEDQAGEAICGQAGNLIATLAGDSRRPPVLLTAHLDTVSKALGAVSVMDNDGTFRGSGDAALGADDKAGVTAILLALEEIVGAHVGHGTIQVVLTVAEELGLQGAKKLDYGLIHAKMGLAFDAEGPLGTFAATGAALDTWTVKIRPKPAAVDAAKSEESAVRLASLAVSRIPRGRVDSQTRVEIVHFSGGDGTLHHANQVRLEGCVRSLNTGTLGAVRQDISNAFEDVGARFGAVATCRWERIYDGFVISEAAPVRLRLEAAMTEFGLMPKPVVVWDGSDANIFCSRGIPVINVGLNYKNVHTADEQIDATDIANAASIAVAFCAGCDS